MYGCLLHTPYWGPGLQPRPVPWLGIEPVTFWFTGWHSIHWATPTRAKWFYFKDFFLKNQIFPFLKNQILHRMVWWAKHSLIRRLHHVIIIIIIITTTTTNKCNLLNTDYTPGARLCNLHSLSNSQTTEWTLLLFPLNRWGSQSTEEKSGSGGVSTEVQRNDSQALWKLSEVA